MTGVPGALVAVGGSVAGPVVAAPGVAVAPGVPAAGVPGTGVPVAAAVVGTPVAESGPVAGPAVLVPAVPQVYSSAQVNGTYTPEVNMLVDTGNQRLTIPQSTSARFYRIGWKSQLQITGISVTGGNVVLSYQ